MVRFLDGLMRGIMAETLSKTLTISDCRNVFGEEEEEEEKDDRWTGVSIKTPDKVTGDSKVNTKSKLLRWAVEKSLKEKPALITEEEANEYISLMPSTFEDEESKVAFKTDMRALRNEEILDGYSIGGDGENSGVLFGDSTMPDSLLTDMDGDIIGFTEVKAYTPFELESLVNKLEELDGQGKLHGFVSEITNEAGDILPKVGVSMASEVQFINHLRTVGFEQKGLDGDTYILLRFANNISDDLINRFGRLIKNWGYKNIRIQRLPMGTRDLTSESKKFIQRNISTISKRTGIGKYTQEDLNLLQRYIDPKLTVR